MSNTAAPGSRTLRPAIFAMLVMALISARTESGCTHRNNTESWKPATQVRSVAFLQEKLRQRDLENARAFQSKIDLYSESDGSAITANGNLIWLRDSAIWFNVKKFGVEVARVLIRPDSVFIIYRMEQTYSAQSMADLQQQYNLPEGFPLLQQLLLGAAWLPENLDYHADIRDSLHRLQALRSGISKDHPQYSIDYRLDEGRFLLRKAAFLQLREGRSLSIDFAQYDKLTGVGIFPYLRRIEAFSPESGHMRLDLTLQEIDLHAEPTYRFEIPAHYAKME